MVREAELHHRDEPEQAIELPVAEVFDAHMRIATARARHGRHAPANREGVRVAQVAEVARVTDESGRQDVRHADEHVKMAVLLRQRPELRLDLGELTIQQADALDCPSQVPHQNALAPLRAGKLREAAGELLQGGGAHELLTCAPERDHYDV